MARNRIGSDVLMKKLAIVVVIVVLAVFGGIKACEHSEMRQSAKYFPEPIKVSNILVHQPGCDSFSCMGGTLFEITERQAHKIRIGGLSYLNGLPSVSSNDQAISAWEMLGASGPSPVFGNKKKAQQKRLLFDAITAEDCFVSNRHYEPLLIICVEAKLAYMGWMD